MSKSKNKKRKSKAHGIMGRSDIPFAQRMAMQHQSDIEANRNHAAKIIMFCESAAMYDVEGIAYKRLIRFAQHFKEVIDEFYEDPDVGMAHAKHRLEQMGMPISGEWYGIEIDGLSQKEHEIQNHRLQAAQIAIICSIIAKNDVFGFGKERQERINKKTQEYTARYNREGEQFLLEKMAEIGFEIVDGEVIAYADDDGNAITPKKWKKEVCADEV